LAYLVCLGVVIRRPAEQRGDVQRGDELVGPRGGSALPVLLAADVRRGHGRGGGAFARGGGLHGEAGEELCSIGRDE